MSEQAWTGIDVWRELVIMATPTLVLRYPREPKRPGVGW
jgi:hypothetical protein